MWLKGQCGRPERCRHLLKQPTVAVGVAERGKGAVAALLGRESGRPVVCVGVPEAAHGSGRAVEHVAHLHAAGHEVFASFLDVRDDKELGLARARRSRGDVGAELDRARRAGRRELNQANVVFHPVGVEPPAELLVERLGTVDVRDRDHDDLEPGVDCPGLRRLAAGAGVALLLTHRGLLERYAEDGSPLTRPPAPAFSSAGRSADARQAPYCDRSRRCQGLAGGRTFGLRGVAMPWFPDFVGAVELARQQTRSRGEADPVARYFSVLQTGAARDLERGPQWPAISPPSTCTISPVTKGDDSRKRTAPTMSLICPTCLIGGSWSPRSA